MPNQLKKPIHLAQYWDKGIGSRVACGRLIDTVKGVQSVRWTLACNEVTCVKCKATRKFKTTVKKV